jgi:hypothetical protein
MPYCNTEIIILDLDKTPLIQVMNKMAVTKFKAERAIRLGNGSVNIDGGLNDVRAIINEQVGLIKFCCRYARDVTRVESLTRDFVCKNPNCKLT